MNKVVQVMLQQTMKELAVTTVTMKIQAYKQTMIAAMEGLRKT